MFDSFIKQAFVIVIITSGLPLVVSSVCSMGVALLQTVTQVQEQTLSYLVRFSTVVIVIYFCGPWFLKEYVNFFQQTLASLEYFRVRP